MSLKKRESDFRSDQLAPEAVLMWLTPRRGGSGLLVLEDQTKFWATSFSMIQKKQRKPRGN